jgi:putative tricarboxylic transport membrane protein
VENILDGLAIVATPAGIGFLLLGLTAGFVAGVLPGFGSANAAAIALPFTFGMPLELALIFFISVYAGSSYAGAIPAILMNVPGTAGAAATALDGFPLAQQGRANLAIGLARMASSVGGVIGMVIVLAIISPMATIALSFGSREMFAVAVFGLTMISTLLGSNVRKSLISALLGLLIAAMSANTMTGQARLTFGFIELYDLVPFVPALIGAFALTQMFLTSGRKSLLPEDSAIIEDYRPKGIAGEVADILEGIKATFRFPRTLIRSSLVGLVVGAIPGTGAVIANFLSYGLAKRGSKNPEEFGKGSLEGVIASEAADNGVACGTLVPTMTLGIPGSGTAAVMLVAFLLHGVQPGPSVMLTHTAAVYATLVALLFASILILPLGVLLAQPLTFVTRLKPAYLVPGVLILAFVGTFANRNSTFDIGVAIIFGLLGVAMRLSGYPIVPLIIALILGPIAEEQMLRSLQLGNGQIGYFVGSPIAIALWVVIVTTFGWGILRDFRARREAQGEPALESSASDD